VVADFGERASAVEGILQQRNSDQDRCDVIYCKTNKPHNVGKSQGGEEGGGVGVFHLPGPARTGGKSEVAATAVGFAAAYSSTFSFLVWV
jgi:hypothetical protein